MFLAPVAAPGGKSGGTPPEHKVFRAERMRIDCRKNLKFYLNFSKFLLKTFINFLKAFKFLINLPKVVQTLTNFSQITIIILI